jgi:hypothetical protein
MPAGSWRFSFQAGSSTPMQWAVFFPPDKIYNRSSVLLYFFHPDGMKKI